MSAIEYAKRVEDAIAVIKPLAEVIPDLELRVAVETGLSLLSDGLKVATESGLMTQNEGDEQAVKELVREHIANNWDDAIKRKFGV